MTFRPLDPEVYARIRADHRTRRGPFVQPIIAVHELVCHYDVRNLKRTQATWALRQLCAREVRGRGHSAIALWIAHPDCPLIKSERPAVLAEYRRARGIPVSVEPSPKPASAPVRARMVADFQSRRGPFVQPIVTVPDLSEHYGAANHSAVMLLSKLSFRSSRSYVSRSAGQITIYVVHDDPRLLTMTPRELLAEYRQAKGQYVPGAGSRETSLSAL